METVRKVEWIFSCRPYGCKKNNNGTVTAILGSHDLSRDWILDLDICGDI